MAGAFYNLGSCVRNRLLSSSSVLLESKCVNFKRLKNLALYSSKNYQNVKPRSRNLLIGLLGIGGGVIAGGIYSYYKLLELRPIPNSSQQNVPKLISALPNINISRTVNSPVDRTGLQIILFQYPTCPFCCKVRAFLDYYGLSYSVVEVNPVLRQQIKWSDYKKVPIVLIRVDGGFQQLNDSSMIISALGSVLHDKLMNIADLVKFYPVIEYNDPGSGRKREIMNRYFLMYQGNTVTIKEEDAKSERKWRKWADEDLVHTLSPNVYRTKEEAFQAFKWFSEVGEWERLFPSWEVSLIINVGAYAMWFIGKRLKKRHNLKDDVRLSLYDSCNVWLKELNKKGTEYHGGSSPNLADLAVYGILSSIEGCDAFKDLLSNTKIGKWYFNMKKLCNEHHGSSLM